MTDYEEVPGQLGLLDALERVERNADDDWKTAARLVVGRLVDTGQPFTTDDVWTALARTGETTHEPRALGAIMQEASRLKLIVKTGRYVKSTRKDCHMRDVAEWVAR